MSEDAQLDHSIDNEISFYADFLAKAPNVAEAIPLAEERKRDAEAKKRALALMPPDVRAEIAPRLLQIQLYDEQHLAETLPTLPAKYLRSVANWGTSGSTSAFVEAVYPVMSVGKEPPKWALQVTEVFSEIAEYKVTRASLADSLVRLKPGLGGEFTDAEASFVKSKSGAIRPHQAAGSMRNVIQQVWGAFAGRARSRDAHMPKEHLELRKQRHRRLVAQALCGPPSASQLEMALDRLARLYEDLSDVTHYSTRRVTSDLEPLHNRWIIDLDALRQFIDQT